MKILLVRLRLIGDVVLTTPIIRALRHRFPDATLSYVVEPTAAPVVADNPHLDDVWVVAHRRGLGRVADDLAMGWRLRRARFDIAIDFHGGPRSRWLTWMTRAPMRVGYDVAGRGWMYTHTVTRHPDLAPRHSVLNQWDLLAPVDAALPAPTPESDPVEMPVTPAATTAIAVRLESLGIQPGAGVVVMHVSAGNNFRRWPEASFAAVAATLAGDGHTVAVVSGPADRDGSTRVISAARAVASAPDRIVSIEGLSLAELRALMDRAVLFVGGDSGPLHIAATSAVPIVGLYGPTLPDRWAAWRPASVPAVAVDGGALPCRPCDQRACAPGDFRCQTGIGPDQVIAASRRLLEPRA